MLVNLCAQRNLGCMSYIEMDLLGLHKPDLHSPLYFLVGFSFKSFRQNAPKFVKYFYAYQPICAQFALEAGHHMHLMQHWRHFAFVSDGNSTTHYEQ